MTLKLKVLRASLPVTALGLLIALAATPARADRCDDIAKELKNQIDGLSVGKTAAGIIYLSHPQAKLLTLGCSARNVSNQLYAKSDSRKPKPAFYDLVAGAAAIIFTLPKDDMQKGASRCMRAIGLFHNDASIRYRRLDMRCMRTKLDTSITISRGIDQ